jgi:hypothetical protein
MGFSRWLLRNPGTKLLALAIACTAWYLLSGERRERISERSYRIALSIVNIPRGTLIVTPVPDAVDVRVRGSFTQLRQLEPGKLEAVVDLIDATPGERRYRLEPEDINLPRQVEVIAISPPEIRIGLDRVEEKTVPILPDLVGRPAPGNRVEDAAVEPRMARIQGPAKTLAGLSSVRTEPVSVEGRDASFNAPSIVAAQSPGVRIREGQIVTVRVRLQQLPTVEPTPARAKKR